MADQKRPQTPAPSKQRPQDQSQPAAEGSSLADGLDDILDEIDEVLETNAEEFVKSYVQKGGE